MSIRPTAEIRKPTNGDRFEIQCRELFALHYKHPEMKISPPSKQFGVDIFGYRDGDLDRPIGIQCKATANLTEREIRDEFRKVLQFDTRLTQWVVATTSDSRSALQSLARALTEESSPDPRRRIEVIIHDWREMQLLIVANPTCLDWFDPLFSPFLAELKEGILTRLDRIEARLGRHLSHDKPVPFEPNDTLFSSLVPIGLSGKPESIPVVFDQHAFFYAHLFPVAPTKSIGPTAISNHIGGAYYEAPPSGHEAWPVRGIGDYTLIARNSPRSSAMVRGLEDGVGFFRNGEAFVFQGIRNTLNIEGVVTSICHATKIQRELWKSPSILNAGIRVRRGETLQFKMGDTEIAKIRPDQDLVSGFYETHDWVPLQLFGDLLESGGLFAEDSPWALARMLERGIRNREEEEDRRKPKLEASSFDGIDF
ncbi:MULTISPECIES: restriction endonuclease [Rhizobium]|uniref:restriction endonuclease n=1 Tax=Rhizobium TaxID=379 RepID=UPI0023618B32|nr:restriction endonuclease [Rhizobium sp. MJ37]MDC9835670.1 restriction endonuclease [Rhizobium sp. MJ37]